MRVTMLKAKIHRATVTGADLEYEGSITIDRQLCTVAGIHQYEKVDIYNCSTGARLSTYVIFEPTGGVPQRRRRAAGAARRRGHHRRLRLARRDRGRAPSADRRPGQPGQHRA